MRRACLLKTNTDEQKTSSIRPFKNNFIPIKKVLLGLFYIHFFAVYGQNVMPAFSLSKVPFSYYNADLSIRHHQINALVVQDVSGNSRMGEGVIVSIWYNSGKQLQLPTTLATPEKITFTHNDTVLMEASFQSSKTIRMRGYGANVCYKFDNGVVVDTVLADKIKLHRTYRYGTSYFQISIVDGGMTLRDSILHFNTNASGVFDVAITTTVSKDEMVTIPSVSFDNCVRQSADAFSQWSNTLLHGIANIDSTPITASYIMWSAMLAPGGHLKRPTMLMSKNTMHFVWSWDHCFNALACSYNLPELAWDQFITTFDEQLPNGQLPDMIGRGRMETEHVKPPIHGWILRLLMKNMSLSHAQMSEAYEKLSLWTNFWFNVRDTNHNGIPEYNHGNDSGWDNGTEFDIDGKPSQKNYRESANLSAFLIIQMEVLHDIALQLNKKEEATRWQQQSDTLLKKMVAHLWEKNRFVTKRVDDNTWNSESKSLMAYLPLILGERLPKHITDTMVKQLANDGYLTSWGLATEIPNTKLYEADGYWRGPIWAPPTFIIVKGLEELKEYNLARQIALRYCNLCDKNGFAENFNATTGEGLRDKAYTWTASVYLLLAREYLQK